MEVEEAKAVVEVEAGSEAMDVAAAAEEEAAEEEVVAVAGIK